MNDYVEMGRRIARLRKQRGLTQGDMARRLDMTRQGYQNYEMGRTKIPVIELPAIAHALRMSRLALMQYLGLVGPGDQTLDEFIRAEAPHFFLLTDDEARSGSIPASAGGITTAATDGNGGSEGVKRQLPPAYHPFAPVPVLAAAF